MRIKMCMYIYQADHIFRKESREAKALKIRSCEEVISLAVVCSLQR